MFLCATKRINKNGVHTYRSTCGGCRGSIQKKYPWKKHKKSYCEFCGFVAISPIQLDVDHIDGNKSNNNESNFKTPCSNCHRLKTLLNKDYIKF